MQGQKTYDFAYVESLSGQENMKKDLENLMAAEEWGRQASGYTGGRKAR
ncbi:MAG: hypothetical protein ABDH29_04870 [Aquificaceae bacterium]